MVGMSGEELTHEERSAIQRYGFGGFILFSHNSRSPEQIVALCCSLWNTGGTLPPFIAIDQEGGRVHRLPAPFTHFPAADLIGRRANPEWAYKIGRATAAELALVGINLNFAPVLDVDSNHANPIIGDRSFSSDPEDVIRFAAKWIEGLKHGGVIPCGKHFPGHGSTDKDSHLELPVVTRSLAELRSVEFPPFVHACRNETASLMTTHVIYSSLDPNFPATLSYPIVTGLLRQEMGYGGVVFSDDLEMKAIRDNFRAEESALLCVRAGIDVLLFCHELPRAMDAFELLCVEAERDPTLRARVEESHGRIARLKQRFLKSFTGAGASEVERTLLQLDHQRLIEEIQDSL